MINRLLIRIKVLQTLYACSMRGNLTVDDATALLEEGLEASYRLYVTLCGLPLALKAAAEKRLLREEDKFQRSAEVARTLQKIIHNPVFDLYNESESTFPATYRETAFDSPELTRYHENVLTELLKDRETAELNTGSEAETKKWWREKYGVHYLQNKAFEELLTELTPYLNDDIRVVFTFVTKFVNALDSSKPLDANVKPKYADQEVQMFGPELLRESLEKGTEYRELTAGYLKNWDKGRVSEIDYIIMQMAVAEAVRYPLMPITIIINEYLNLAHYYSSANSHVYINGILNEMLKDLKEQQ